MLLNNIFRSGLKAYINPPWFFKNMVFYNSIIAILKPEEEGKNSNPEYHSLTNWLPKRKLGVGGDKEREREKWNRKKTKKRNKVNLEKEAKVIPHCPSHPHLEPRSPFWFITSWGQASTTTQLSYLTTSNDNPRCILTFTSSSYRPHQTNFNNYFWRNVMSAEVLALSSTKCKSLGTLDELLKCLIRIWW